jgi:DNA-binding PadR family transcriptional regulator
VSELARAGLIQYTGENRTVETGEEQRCYRITAAGLAALREMDG